MELKQRQVYSVKIICCPKSILPSAGVVGEVSRLSVRTDVVKERFRG